MATKKPTKPVGAIQPTIDQVAELSSQPKAMVTTATLNRLAEQRVARPGLAFKFATEKGSPFDDGYSIAGEERALAEFFADPKRAEDMADPDYDRYIELEDRKARLEIMRERFASRNQAEAVVTHSEAISLNTLGGLVDEEEDTLEIHTLEALRMFMGRARNPDARVQPIVGGKRVASALRGLWALTANDNPYADWALVRHEQTIKEVSKRLKQETDSGVGHLEHQKKRGLSYSVLKSSAAKSLSLGFKSPYGYAVASLVSDFDYFIRVQKTLARKNLLSDEQVRSNIALITRLIRRVLNETVRFDRWLMRDEVRALCRSDFLPGAGDMSGKRVEFANGVFGPVPVEVFSCALQPRHSRRRVFITAPERELLKTVGQAIQQKAVASQAAEADSVAATSTAE
jgi:integrating conjugative element protein (TIGR03761 family)